MKGSRQKWKIEGSKEVMEWQNEQYGSALHFEWNTTKGNCLPHCIIESDYRK